MYNPGSAHDPHMLALKKRHDAGLALSAREKIMLANSGLLPPPKQAKGELMPHERREYEHLYERNRKDPESLSAREKVQLANYERAAPQAAAAPAKPDPLAVAREALQKAHDAFSEAGDDEAAGRVTLQLDALDKVQRKS